ncbi:hypothetical protein RISK_005797 [Rhodopirellula islandica]|uniref:Uncharacterized protein n=1 Tax=Rhodopirellula islandica TaxID=595434 RepID=A0A0J1B5X0_RHOIS|nr:hypothetical protein RISK_005797 [Rhodopirellula islandica]
MPDLRGPFGMSIDRQKFEKDCGCDNRSVLNKRQQRMPIRELSTRLSALQSLSQESIRQNRWRLRKRRFREHV